MKTRLLIFIQFCFLIMVHAQPPGVDLSHFINGFERKVSGTDFSYHSSIPEVKESLIIRATDGKSVMEWETAPVKIQPGAKTVTVVWLAGIGSSPGKAVFEAEINKQ